MTEEQASPRVGITEGWIDAFKIQHSNIPIFQHPISSYAMGLEANAPAYAIHGAWPDNLQGRGVKVT
jgi:hypothetical protein